MSFMIYHDTYNDAGRFYTSNARNFLILNQTDPKLVSEPVGVGKYTCLSSLNIDLRACSC